MKDNFQRSAPYKVNDTDIAHFQAGDLIKLKRPNHNSTAMGNSIVLGSICDDKDLTSDPVVPTGTICMVQGVFVDRSITSEMTYKVMLEYDGRPQSFWVYASEMTLVVRP
jgi:hypothetical protein